MRHLFRLVRTATLLMVTTFSLTAMLLGQNPCGDDYFERSYLGNSRLIVDQTTYLSWDVWTNGTQWDPPVPTERVSISPPEVISYTADGTIHALTPGTAYVTVWENYSYAPQWDGLECFGPGDAGTYEEDYTITVSPQFTIAYSAYIPDDHVTGPTSCNYGSITVDKIYMGDGGRNSYRTTETMNIIPDLVQASGFFPDTGPTRNYGYLSPGNGSTLSQSDEDNAPNDCYLWNASDKADPSSFTHDESFPPNVPDHQGQEHMEGQASNPLEPSLFGLISIKWDMRTTIDTTVPQSPTAIVSYNHTCYPAHQIKVNGAPNPVYFYRPGSNDKGYIFNCLSGFGKIFGQQSSPTPVPWQ